MSTFSPAPLLPQATIAPWLSVNHVAMAADFYMTAFGATELYRLEDDNGHMFISNLSIMGAEFWLQEDPDFSPEYVRHGSFRMIVMVQNPDAMFEQAIKAGATEVTPMSEGHGWRIGRLVDPFGYHWEIGIRL